MAYNHSSLCRRGCYHPYAYMRMRIRAQPHMRMHLHEHTHMQREFRSSMKQHTTLHLIIPAAMRTHPETNVVPYNNPCAYANTYVYMPCPGMQ